MLCTLILLETFGSICKKGFLKEMLRESSTFRRKSHLSRKATLNWNLFHKLQSLVGQICKLSSSSVCKWNCTYGAQCSSIEIHDWDHVMWFLMGLNEFYALIRGHILLIEPPSNINKAFFLWFTRRKAKKYWNGEQLCGSSTNWGYCFVFYLQE